MGWLSRILGWEPVEGAASLPTNPVNSLNTRATAAPQPIPVLTVSEPVLPVAVVTPATMQAVVVPEVVVEAPKLEPAPKPDPVAIPAVPKSAPTVPSADPLITSALLAKLGWVDPIGYALPMERACFEYGILGRQRLACWLGQTGHESERGKFMRELWGPTAAQRGYEGRKDLGNTQPGDGYRFRGRGLIQITGRANYEKAAAAFRMSLEAFTAWMDTREGAVTSAAWWWKNNGCNELADRATTEAGFEALTRRINGGMNGLSSRTMLKEAARKALG